MFGNYISNGDLYTMRLFDIPEAEDCQIWIDFDGTISQKDVLDELIFRFSVDDSWKQLEKDWRENKIGSRKCLEGEFDLLRVSVDEINEVLDSIKIDKGLFEILELASEHSVPITILSDGVDIFIKRILSANGITNLNIKSNSAILENNRVQLVCPNSNPMCDAGSAHCKCSSMEKLGDSRKKNIYIGDGRSDLCPSRKADVVFAKKVLADNLRAEDYDFIEYETLADVSLCLSDSWEAAVAAEQKVHPACADSII
ncbi:MAG TPA: MtnX-like HAD-IB family phosphatase [Spirochaetota bacterium]|nr:MtnX-like HAD-IB family phosphatase [Spirochaetota bacterium]HOR44699.1 MtnX-like HAD-IB family phosphatase [Spirochaetota bacterium]HPK56498.1 MtnX-like HAD-IB family phosphatase [Spirochaetota bacterium]HPK56510.1 MtnX-like HAD-IB family phosphatase [Spirochaetota bacterium]